MYLIEFYKKQLLFANVKPHLPPSLPQHNIWPPPLLAPFLHSVYCVLIAVWYCFAVYAKPLDGP